MRVGVALLISLAACWGQVAIVAKPHLGESGGFGASHRVELINRGAAESGRLELIGSGGERRFIPIELPTGARKAVDVFFDEPRTTRRRGRISLLPALYWQPDNGARREIRLNLSPTFDSPFVVLGDLKGGFEAVRLMAERALGQESRWVASRIPAPVYMAPEDAPLDIRWLRPVSVLILVEGAERLSREQQVAILAWAASGGRVVVSGIGPFPGLRGSLIGDLAPKIIGQSMIDGEPQAIYEPNRVLGLSAPHPPILKPYGQGEVYFYATTAASQRRFSDILQIASSRIEESRRPEAATVLLEVDKDRMILASVCLALFFFSLLILRLALRKMSRLTTGPALIALLCAIAAIVVSQLLPETGVKTAGTPELRLIGSADSPIYLASGEVRWLAPRGEWRKTFPANAAVDYSGAFFASRTQRVSVNEGSETVVEGYNATVAEVSFRVEQAIDLGGAIRVERVSDVKGLSQVVRVENNTHVTLTEVTLNANEVNFRLADRLEPGQSKLFREEGAARPTFPTQARSISVTARVAGVEGLPSNIHTAMLEATLP